MTRVGLVLGAGGNVGQAYHAGVLTALENDLGWDPRTADVLVGTSAGSVVGTLLALGAPASDLAASIVEAPLSPDGAPVLEPIQQVSGPLPPLSLMSLFRGPWRPPSPALIARAMRRPWAVRPDVVAMTLLPDGNLDLFDHAGEALRSLGERFPPQLRICAARRSDGRRVVFGRAGSPPAPLSHAVAASCAIPGYFSPVSINGVSYFDGGVHSPTNADVLRDAELDLVIVLSPMSSVRGRGRGLQATMRRDAHRRLAREVAVLRAAGTSVVRFEPGRRALAVMSGDALATDQARAIVQAGFLEGGRWASSSRVAPLLASIATRRSAARPAAGTGA